jgi:pimeloyl-ACP methyl ester carboxylesterase
MGNFSRRHVSIHGHDVGFRLAGEGDAVVLVHGMAGSSDTWRAVIGPLARTHRVLAPDLLGHGESAKPTGDYSLGAYASGLRDLMGVVGIERATVVGNSLGGGVAMQLAYQHPELVERLVLVDSGGLGREVSWILRALTLPAAEYVMPLVFPSFVRRWGDAVDRFVSSHGWSAPHVAEIWHAYGSLTEVENRQAFVRTLRAVIDPGGQTVSARDRLYLAAAVPTMVVWGEDDPIIPVEHAYQAHQAMPGSRLEVMAGVGHFPQVERPRAFLELVEDFMSTTLPSTLDLEAYRAAMLRTAG